MEVSWLLIFFPMKQTQEEDLELHIDKVNLLKWILNRVFFFQTLNHSPLASFWIKITTSFTKVSWPGDNERTFGSCSQAATCWFRPVHMMEASQCLFNIKCQAENRWIPIFIVLGLIRLRIEPHSTISFAGPLPHATPDWFSTCFLHVCTMFHLLSSFCPHITVYFIYFLLIALTVN